MELAILYAIQGLHRDWLNPIMIFLSAIGEAGMIWIMISIVLAVIPRTRRCGLTMLAAMALSFLLGNCLLKNLIARPRPCAVDPGIQLLVPFPSEYSFPSGHTLNGFTAAVTIFLHYRRIGIAALLLAGTIAFSRLYLFVHYPTDILGGLALGIADACLTVLLVKKYFIRRKLKKAA